MFWCGVTCETALTSSREAVLAGNATAILPSLYNSGKNVKKNHQQQIWMPKIIRDMQSHMSRCIVLDWQSCNFILLLVDR